MSDNFHFDLTGVPLDKCLEIAFIGAPGGKAEGWSVLPALESGKSPSSVWGANRAKERLVLFWSINETAATPFPAKQTAEEAAMIVRAWLETADYGKQPDQDGSNKKGWRVYNEAWGHVAGQSRAFVAIEPVWLMYGK